MDESRTKADILIRPPCYNTTLLHTYKVIFELTHYGYKETIIDVTLPFSGRHLLNCSWNSMLETEIVSCPQIQHDYVKHIEQILVHFGYVRFYNGPTTI